MGFSADYHNGQNRTELPGENVISSDPKDADGIFIANVEKLKADTQSTIPPSHIDPATGFIKSDIPGAQRDD